MSGMTEIAISLGEPIDLGRIIDGFAEVDTRARLGAGLPEILMNGDDRSVWFQLYGGEKGFNDFFRALLADKGIPEKLQKVAISAPFTRTHEIFSRMYSIPQLRQSEGSSGMSFSKRMLSRLMQFPEYKAYSLEQAKDDLENILFSDRGELFSDLPFFASAATFPPLDEAVTLRLLRLSKLSHYFGAFDSLPKKKRVDLIMGVHGLFDALDCPWIFIELLEAYPKLISEFSGLSLVGEYQKSCESKKLALFKLQLIVEATLKSSEFDPNVALPMIVRYEPFAVAAKESEVINYDFISKKLISFAEKLKPHHSGIEVLSKLGAAQDISDLANFSLAYSDVYSVGVLLSRISRHEYMESLENKDEEKNELIKALKNLDPTNIEAAVALAERVRAFGFSVVDAPDDLKKQLAIAVSLCEQLVSKYPIRQVVECVSEAATVVDDGIPDIGVDEVTGLNTVVFSLQQELAESRDENSKLTERNDNLRSKVAEQKQEIGRLKSIRNSLQVTEINKPVAYDGGFVSAIAQQISGGIKTPEDYLRVYAQLYPDRLIVLDSAYESAKKSWEYRNGDKLGKNLFILMNDYYNECMSGVPDSKTRLLFGTKILRDNESDTVLANDKLRSQREFEYEGEKRVFEKHIALGIKYGAANCLRLYFEIIEGKVVIAYCGEHLSNTRTC